MLLAQDNARNKSLDSGDGKQDDGEVDLEVGPEADVDAGNCWGQQGKLVGVRWDWRRNVLGCMSMGPLRFS